MKADVQRFMISISFTLFLIHGYSQNASLSGKVLDDMSSEEIAYANILIQSLSDSLEIKGTVTDVKGSFKVRGIKPGRYLVRISFIGYHSVVLNDLMLHAGSIDLGIIRLALLHENLPEVSVISKTPPVTYKVDRKVIDAGSFPNANYAIELLENIPSFRVDMEGKISYRGDGTFIILMNGKPIANGEERLRQLPVEQLDKIELITNPSAKYDAEGTAGLINVIMKKRRLEGYAVNLSARANSLEEYGTNFSVDYKDKKKGWFSRGNLSHDVSMSMEMEQDVEIRSGTHSYNNYLNKEERRISKRNFIEAGGNYLLSERDHLEISGYLNPFINKSMNKSAGYISERKYQSEIFTGNEDYRYSAMKQLIYKYMGATLSYERHSLANDNQQLTAYIDYSGYARPLDEKYIETKYLPGQVHKLGYLGTEKNETVIEGKINYEFAMREKIKIETGFDCDFQRIPLLTSKSGVFDDTGGIIPFNFEPGNQWASFKQWVTSAYIISGFESDKAGIQVGIRGEQTFRESNLEYENHLMKIIPVLSKHSFFDFFPSIHSSYSLNDKDQVYSSYSRRIQRPDYWSLTPLKQYDNPFSYYTGNQFLSPAYSHALEAGYKRSKNKNFFTGEIFHRSTSNIIQNYFRPDTANLLAYTPKNVGNDKSTGIELMKGVYIFPWWNMNTSATSFYYQVETKTEEVSTMESQFRAHLILNNHVTLRESFMLKWTLNFNSPVIFSQGKQSGYYFADISLTKNLFNNWIITASARDIFKTINYTMLLEGEDYRIFQKIKMKPFFSIRISYSFNNQG